MTLPDISNQKTRQEIFDLIQKYLDTLSFTVVAKDHDRPWGGFFVIDESQAGEFSKTFFSMTDPDSLKIGGKLSPKILVVEPGKRLSWQYHHRRAEIWKLIAGKAGVAVSHTDEEGEAIELETEEMVRLNQGQRHRLIGLDQWGVVAEIWQHTDVNHPSDEEDIVRLQDDFGR
jgi:mannose-6-phosphate isomerase-like protein (cupin superfamily)